MPRVAKGYIEQLPSGSFRVSVCAGTDPLTRRAIHLKATVKTEQQMVPLAVLPHWVYIAHPRRRATGWPAQMRSAFAGDTHGVLLGCLVLAGVAGDLRHDRIDAAPRRRPAGSAVSLKYCQRGWHHALPHQTEIRTADSCEWPWLRDGGRVRSALTRGAGLLSAPSILPW